MKKKVYLVRHGQTEFNVQKRCQGWKDSPLTRKGIQQALAIRSWFEEQDIHFDHAYSSDLQRAMDTMFLITRGMDIPCYTSRGLREMSFGKYDGWKHADIPEIANIDRDTYFKNVGGETAEEAVLRAYHTIVFVMRQKDVEHALFVSHGIPVSGLYNSLPHAPGVQEAKDFRNGCISVYEFEDDEMILVDFVQIEEEEFKL